MGIALEAVLDFQVRKPHFDPLPFIARFGEGFGLHRPPRDIAGVLVEIAWDFARVSRCATLCPDRADITVGLGGPVEQRATCPQHFAVGANVGILLAIPAEVRA